jgi:hypothetical protein
MVDPASRTRVDNLSRVETFGNPDVQWVRVRVDVKDYNAFVFEEGRPTK